MKILTIVGARPQFIKAAVLSRLIANDSSVNEIIVHTGQHYDSNMSEVFFEEMSIPRPLYNLHVKSKLHGEMTGKMIIEIEKIALKETPDCILVYGDTNSTIAGAFVAAKLGIKLAHVEAGLRSFNNSMPEEINRIVTDRLSDVLFCPTENSVENLMREGFEYLKEKEIVRTGDIMLDASIYYSSINIQFSRKIPEKFILCTIHRAENTDNNTKLVTIFDSLNHIGKENPIVIPLHPRTKGKLEKIKPDYQFIYENIYFLDPLSYFEMIWCLKNCIYVITDSGGLQKEAYFFKKMCLTLRDETEWIELVDYGYNILSPIEKNEIINKANSILNFKVDFDTKLYGDGNTGVTILKSLKSILSQQDY